MYYFTQKDLDAHNTRIIAEYVRSCAETVTHNMRSFQPTANPNISTYQWQQMVIKLFKSGRDIQNSLSPEKCELLHSAIGIVGEAGELADAIKKHVIYGKELDIANIIEELGDLFFFIESTMNNPLILTTRETCLRANYQKLNKRYENGYSDAAAQARVDKGEEPNTTMYEDTELDTMQCEKRSECPSFHE